LSLVKIAIWFRCARFAIVKWLSNLGESQIFDNHLTIAKRNHITITKTISFFAKKPLSNPI